MVKKLREIFNISFRQAVDCFILSPLCTFLATRDFGNPLMGSSSPLKMLNEIAETASSLEIAIRLALISNEA